MGKSWATHPERTGGDGRNAPQELEVAHLADALKRAGSIVEAEIGRKVRFGNFDEAVDFFRTI